MISEQSEQSEPSVLILMGTYNGEKFLAEQLDSISAQTHSNWRLIASDDGSSDRTLHILTDYQRIWGLDRLEIRQGPCNGFCANFMSLASDPSIQADFYAFSDQDDVWLPEKLQMAISAIEDSEDRELPHLYCGRSFYVSEALEPCGESAWFTFPKKFRNALVQCVAGGNTMVFNKATKRLLILGGSSVSTSHDWWAYIMVTGAGGKVIFDDQPQILYRQHPQALVGQNGAIRSKLERFNMVFKGSFKVWNSKNIEVLQGVRDLLTPSAVETLDIFIKMRDSGFKDRLRLFKVGGFYRQTRRGTVSLFLALVLRLI